MVLLKKNFGFLPPQHKPPFAGALIVRDNVMLDRQAYTLGVKNIKRLHGHFMLAGVAS